MRYLIILILIANLLSVESSWAQFSDKFPMAQPKKAVIQQFHDDGLAHYSYAILVGKQVVIIDPSRNPEPYYDFAKKNSAEIVAIFNTHPHADFVSSHLEIHLDKSAKIFTSSLVGADYPHEPFDEGAVFDFGNGVKIQSMHTPGHSPDGISLLLIEDEKQIAVFTGDTLFIGDVGRPDLRETAGNILAQRKELAKMLYYSTREKLMKLEDDVLVYPAHGAGSLCGKAISSENVSTIAKEKATNYALQEMTEIAFIDLLLEDQPFIPKYFTYNVEVNKRGAGKLTESIQKTVILKDNFLTQQSALPIIDGRNESAFKSSHLPGAINIISGPKFESWLGALLSPGQSFYLVADNNENLQSLIKRAAKIGYEKYIVGAFIYDLESGLQTELFNKIAFDQNPSAFTVLDIRTETENAKKPVFKNALNIPLHELENRAHEIPTDKPIIVHCATGYRSAAGSSLISKKLPQAKVIDMGGAIKTYQ